MTYTHTFLYLTSHSFRQGGAGSSAGALAGGLAVVMTAATLFNKEQVTPTACAAAPSKVPYTGLPGTDKERTFIAIKPDGVQRGLIGKSYGDEWRRESL